MPFFGDEKQQDISKHAEIERVKNTGQSGLRTCGPTGYEFADFPPFSAGINCLQHHDRAMGVLRSNEEKCCHMTKIGGEYATRVP
jgi:hypothetical protein